MLSALAGLYVLHALWRIQEKGERSERQVFQQLAIEAPGAVGNLCSIGGAIGGLFEFRRLSQRRWSPSVHGTMRAVTYKAG